MTKPEEAKKISEKSAKDQIDSMLDYFGLSFDDIVREEGKAVAQTIENTLVRAIQRTELEINVEGGVVVTQHLKYPIGDIKRIDYKGKKLSLSRIAMDKGGESNQTRMYYFMAAMAGIEWENFLKLDGPDLTIYNRIVVLFSMV